MSERSPEYFQNYYRNISRPKTLANRALAAAACQICGDEWASTHAGWNSALFVCVYLQTANLANWERGEGNGKETSGKPRVNSVSVEPAESAIHEASQLRCCVNLQRPAVGRGGRRAPVLGTS